MNTSSHTPLNATIDEIPHLLTLAHKRAVEGKTNLQISCSNLDINDDEVNPACFKTLNPMLLACIAAEGIQEVYIETCENCATQQILSTIDDYQALSQAMAIKLNTHMGNKPEIKTKPIQEDEPERRTFFKTLIPTVAKHAANTVEQVLGESRQADDIQLALDQDKRPLSQLSKLFLRALPKLNINHIPVPYLEGVPLGSIQASEACTACGDCVETCPTDALNLKPFGQHFILEFQADCCTGCQQCITSCPEQAIELLPSISLPSLLQNNPRPLTMVKQ